MQILVPTASARPSEKSKATRLATLAGKRFAIVSNGWRSMDAMGRRVSERLKADGVIAVDFFPVHINKPITNEALDEIAAYDAAIVGLAN